MIGYDIGLATVEILRALYMCFYIGVIITCLEDKSSPPPVFKYDDRRRSGAEAPAQPVAVKKSWEKPV